MIGEHDEDEYLSVEFFEDRDLEIRNRERKIVIARAEHRCSFADVVGKPHVIQPGSRAIYEKAVVEGRWGAWWGCLDCLDKWLDEEQDR